MGDVAGSLGMRIAVETLFVESEPGIHGRPNPARGRDSGRRTTRMSSDARRQPQLSDDRLPRRFLHRSGRCLRAGHRPFPSARFVRPPAGSLGGFYTDSERVAFGVGDLHLPFGWGDIPFETLLPGLPVLPGTVLTVELPERHWGELDACAAFARGLMQRMNARR